MKVWDIDAEKEIRTLGGYTNVKCAAAATPDGRRVITGSSDDTASVWAPLESSEALHVLRGHAAPITALAITPDGTRAISASEDQTLKLWDLQQGTELPRFGGHLLSANLLAITPDAHRAVSASLDGSLRFWDVENGSELRSRHHHGQAIKALALSPDGARVVFSSGKTLNVLDLERDTPAELAGHDGVIRTIAPTSGALLLSKNQIDAKPACLCGTGWILDRGARRSMTCLWYPGRHALVAVSAAVRSRRTRRLDEPAAARCHRLWRYLETGLIPDSARLKSMEV